MLNRRSPTQAGLHAKDEWSTLALIGTLVATLAVLYLAKEIFIPLAFALALSFILAPLVTWLQRIHLGRVPSVLIVMIAVVASTAAVSWMVANQLIDVADHLPAYRENIHNKIQGFRAPATGALGRVEKSVAEIGKELAGTELAEKGRSDVKRASINRDVAITTRPGTKLV